MAADILIIFLHAFNILDGFFTIKAVSLGVGEANPLLKPLINTDPMLFLITKVFVFMAALTFLDYKIQRPLYRYVVFGSMTLLYALVLCWHIAGLHEMP